jgi:enoyl-CoA hydratase/carnithine racemase
LPRAIEIAERIAEQAPLAVQATLASARNRNDPAESKQVFERLEKLLKSSDLQRAVMAFMTKSKTVFKGD